jgi:FkbM family methyltransferase
MTGPFVSHAQNFEDVRLWRAFSDIEQGRYLDIGTQDPVRDSVSLAFYERGWRGVHVEPTPAYAAAMRLARPDETVIEAAVSNASGPIQFFEIPETGISTGVAEIAQRHRMAGWEHRVITVPTVTLAGLFDLMGAAPIHWLKIDVEGMEADVLESWGNHPARPIALVIEATAPNTQTPTHQAWYDLVLSRGYRDVLFDGLSRYFIHETNVERGTALALSPNVFDGVHVESSHFLAGGIVAEKEAAIGAAWQQAEVEREVALAATTAMARAEREEALATALAQAEAERLAEIGVLHQQAETKHQEALAAALAQAEAKHLDEVAALQRQAESERTEALTTALTQAAAVLDATRTALEGRIEAGEQVLVVTRQALAAQQQESRALAHEVGRLEGQLAAQTADGVVRMRDAQAVRRDLTMRLARSERALEAARANGADLREKVQALIGEHALSLMRANASLEAVEAREAQLTHQFAEISRDLAGSEARREQAERQRDEALQQAAAQAAAHAADLERLHAHIAWREDQLGQAIRLFDQAPDPLAGWPRRVAALLARIAGRQPEIIRAGHAAQVEAWLAATALPAIVASEWAGFSLADNPPMSDLGRVWKDLDMSGGEGPVTSVPRLMAPHDAEFIRTAYEAVLGRAPDPEGGSYYLNRLRSGVHKLEILRQLRRSSEGREFVPGVAGLDRAIRRHRRANLPLLGWIVRSITGAEGSSATQRQLRAIANEVGCLHAEQASLFRAVAALADRPVVVTCTGVTPSVSQPEGAAQEAPVQPKKVLSALPALATTLDAIGPMASFEQFLSSLQSSVANSREAAVLNQS